MTIPALRAIIFDFNGVIADDEPTHFLAFQQALAEDGLALTKEEYYGTYLGMDERTCAGALLEAITGRHDPARVQRIAERKAALFASLTETRRPPLFPGVVEFVTRASARDRRAIGRGGPRDELHDSREKRGPARAIAWRSRQEGDANRSSSRFMAGRSRKPLRSWSPPRTLRSENRTPPSIAWPWPASTRRRHAPSRRSRPQHVS